MRTCASRAHGNRLDRQSLILCWSLEAKAMAEHYPPAQRVGHEFVRHYYTLLHEDPLQLHRFYLENSSFVHAGDNSDDDAVVGQTNIYEKINSLSFVECRARIKQVDSQPTLADGVVVQVTGEISNNRQPMRPFVQTFVLSPEGPKKYYVRNDIFRYQDEIYEVESGESVGQSTAGIEADRDDFVVSGSGSQQYDTTAVQNGQEQERMDEQERALEEHTGPEKEMEPESENTATTVNETSELEDVEPIDQTTKQGSASSWANIASKSSAQPTTQRATPKVTTTIAPSQPPQPQREPPQTSPQPQREHLPARRPMNSEQPAVPAERPVQPRPQKPVYLDSQQIFVGNIPAAMDDNEFRELFQQYGTVLEVRLNPRHFGFVTFENPDTVTHLLSGQTEVKFRGHRLNIEEKKSNLPRGRGRDNTGMSGNPGRGGRMDRDRDRCSGRGGGRPPHDSQKY